MHVLYQAFWLPKAGNVRDEYEDAYWPEEVGVIDAQCFKCAIADGASESTFSGPWAKLLVSGYSTGRFSDAKSLDAALPAMQEQWIAGIDSNGLEWFAEEKLRTGAFATIAGLTLFGEEENEKVGKWEGLAVGDSCIFQTRGDSITYKFPVSKPEDFNSNPDLLGSVGHNAELEERVRIANGEWEAGDVFFLATDAVSNWLFMEQSEKGDSWTIAYLDLLVENMEGYETHIQALRKRVRDSGAKALKNDDVTLLQLCVG